MLLTMIILAAVLAACGGGNGNGETTTDITAPQTNLPNDEGKESDQMPNGAGVGNDAIDATGLPAATPEPVWDFAFNRTVFNAGSYYIIANNRFTSVSVAPFVQDGVLYVPLDYAIQAAGDDLAWFTRDMDPAIVSVALDAETKEVDSITVDGTIFVSLAQALDGFGGRSAGWYAGSETLVINAGGTIRRGSTTWGPSLGIMPETWYGGQESIRIANNLIYFQRHDGGWPRGSGQGGNAPHNPADIANIPQERLLLGLEQRDRNDSYFGRGITTNETWFMLRMYEATRIPRFGESAMAGLEAILRTQYQEGEGRGGWPYNITEPRGYLRYVTINDDSYVTIMSMLQSIKNGQMPSVIYGELRERVEQAYIDGLDMILRLQVPSTAFADGQERLTAWAQQMSPETGLPGWGREFEPPSISGSESIDIIRFLMDIPDPCERIQNAIHSAIYFFAYAEMVGYSYHREIQNTANPAWGATDREIRVSPGSANLWARFICVDTFNPIFSDRRNPSWRDGELTDEDGRIGQVQDEPGGIFRHIYREDGSMDIPASFANVSFERRNGYQYVGPWGQVLPGWYTRWLADNNLTSPNR